MSSVTLAFTALEKAFAAARFRGWSSCEVSLDSARLTIEFQRIGLQPTRRGGSPIGALDPQPTGQAHPLSLSAKYGLGPFPLHTDGANLRRTPEFTLLEVAEETDVPTLLFDLGSAVVPTDLQHAFRNGVFAVGRGASSFYAHALDQDGDVRYDPGCMFPVDPPARAVRSWLEDVANSAVEHHWKPGETLVIANRRCLHGRPDVTQNPDRSLRRLMVHWDR